MERDLWLDITCFPDIWPEREQPSIHDPLGDCERDIRVRRYGQKSIHGSLMKSCLISARVSALIFVVSLSFAQNQPETEKPARNTSHDYSELTKAPEKARVRAN